jgi:hypothetical protein
MNFFLRFDAKNSLLKNTFKNLRFNLHVCVCVYVCVYVYSICLFVCREREICLLARSKHTLSALQRLMRKWILFRNLIAVRIKIHRKT